MTGYDPKKHHRRSIRLKGYDYSKPGNYYVTFCSYKHKCYFGEVVDERMILNEPGQMVDKWYRELENKFPGIRCGEYVIMPNHFHGIIEIIGNNNPDGTDHDVPETTMRNNPVGIDLRVPEITGRNNPVGTDGGVPKITSSNIPIGTDLRVCPNKNSGGGEHAG
jgi:putative transposase